MRLLAGLGVEELVGIALGGLTVVLVGPGPLWVRRWRFLVRVPRAAVVLWQAGALSSLVAVALSAVVVAPLLHPTSSTQRPSLFLFDLLVLLFACLVFGRLLWSLVHVAAQTSSRRRRHRAAIDLLGQPLGRAGLARLPGLLVLESGQPLAYCVPGVRDSRVVVTKAALDVLGEDELEAVLEHERAHLRARHDVVLDVFIAVHRAFPLVVRSEIPAEQCRMLVEMLADDAAVRRTGPLPLARALATLAGGGVPGDALAAGGTALVARLERLVSPPVDTRRLSVGVYLLSAALVVAPFVLWGAAVYLRQGP